MHEHQHHPIRGTLLCVAALALFACMDTTTKYLTQTRDFDGTRLQFVTRTLSFNQLRGFHRLSVLGDAEVDWQANLSRVDRDEPDTRDITYYVDEDGTKTFRNQPGSGDRFFAIRARHVAANKGCREDGPDLSNAVLNALNTR